MAGLVAHVYLHLNVAYLRSLREFFHELPSVFSLPWQALRILRIISESVLAKLTLATGNDVVNSLLDRHPTADLVDQLEISC